MPWLVKLTEISNQDQLWGCHIPLARHLIGTNAAFRKRADNSVYHGLALTDTAFRGSLLVDDSEASPPQLVDMSCIHGRGRDDTQRDDVTHTAKPLTTSRPGPRRSKIDDLQLHETSRLQPDASSAFTIQAGPL